MPPADREHSGLGWLTGAARQLRDGLEQLGNRAAEAVRDGIEGRSIRAALARKEAQIAELEARAREAEERDQTRFLALEAELRQLKKHFIGPKSERIPAPTPEEEIRKADGLRADPAETRKKRLENALAREDLPIRRFVHEISGPARSCSTCSVPLMPALGVEVPPIIEYVGDGFVREEHVLERLVCATCGFTVIAPEPPRVVEGGRYGPGFMAFLAVAKCGDSIPIYRLEKSFKRLGISMPRSTMNDLLHAVARELEPIYKRLMTLLKASRIVRADETSMRVQKRKKRGFVWTFITELEDPDAPGWIVAYKFSPDRSGQTPKDVLDGTTGYLMVDAYSGYNIVVDVDGRIRACCNAHARRKFHESLDTAPLAAHRALEFYLDLYRIERRAKQAGIYGEPEHLELREKESAPLMERFHTWLEQEQPNHLPKGPMGVAISYALKHWSELTRFLDDARIPVDNNFSEGSLRVVALGRKNFLHFGNDTAGQNIAMLYTLVSTCEANEINPIAYLKDVLLRVQSHPASKNR